MQASSSVVVGGEAFFPSPFVLFVLICGRKGAGTRVKDGTKEDEGEMGESAAALLC